MKREHFLILLFLLVCGVFFYLFYSIIAPFFVPIAWATVFGILFYPLYERVLGWVKSRGLASLIVCILIVVLIIGPLGYLFFALVGEARDAVVKVNELYQTGKLQELLNFDVPWLDAVKVKLGQYIDLSQVNVDNMVRDAISRVSSLLVNQTTWLVTNATKTVFFFVLMIFSTYYFFKEGEYIICRLKRLMPFTEQRVDKSFAQLRDVIQATMYGGVVVALVQGIIGGLLFWTVGISSPIFWGFVMSFLSLLPFIGAFIVYIPAGLILIFGGALVKGLIVIIIGTLIISQIDNVLRPYLIAGKTCLHPLLLFFAILGGIPAFGLLGIVVGPIIAAAFLTLLDVFEFQLHEESDPTCKAADSG